MLGRRVCIAEAKQASALLSSLTGGGRKSRYGELVLYLVSLLIIRTGEGVVPEPEDEVAAL